MNTDSLFVAIPVSLLMLLGAGFCLIAAIGIIRLPDVYSRLHAASKAVMLGVALPLIAVCIASPTAPVLIKSLFSMVFICLTTPVAAHLIARAAYREGVPPCDQTVCDEYAPHAGSSEPTSNEKKESR